MYLLSTVTFAPSTGWPVLFDTATDSDEFRDAVEDAPLEVWVVGVVAVLVDGLGVVEEEVPLEDGDLFELDELLEPLPDLEELPPPLVVVVPPPPVDC